ncbi:hypothetical protein [Kitasatospora sp. NPDC058190]|uniref:hypothetical protein n=1 Tax=Kitasatospora sp. NPDC058190 TaxID=3346371 RepID=UPI0036DE5948
MDGWAVLVDGRYLVDSTAPGHPLACDTAADAALIVRQALEQGLIDATGPRQPTYPAAPGVALTARRHHRR